MSGSVKHYDKHVIVCDTTDEVWGKNLDNDEDGVVFHLGRSLRMLKDMYPETKIKITACTYNHNIEDPPLFSFIVYPEGNLVSFSRPKTPIATDAIMDTFTKYLLTGDKEHLILSSQSSIVTIEKPFWKHLLLVCTHRKRDERCGKAGPEVKNHTMENKMQNR